MTRTEAAVAGGTQAAAVAVGVTLLVLRPALADSIGGSSVTVAGLFVGLLVVGLAVPVPQVVTGRPPLPLWLTVVAAGTVVFLVTRLLGGGRGLAPLSGRLLGLNVLAAVAEEALFRRLAFGALAPGGVAWAVGGSALLFGLAHVTVYGWWALPVDLAAGLVLSWQRLATGTWTAPAVTHVFADILSLI